MSRLNRMMLGILTATAIATPVWAQTQAQFDRIDRVTENAIYTGGCYQFGFDSRVDSAESILADIVSEMSAEGIPRAEVERLAGQAANRHASRFTTDLNRRLAEAKSTPNLRAKTIEVYTDILQRCVQASLDPIVGKYMTAPSGLDVHSKATEIADRLLEDGGQASWQTPQIRARGDLVSVAGACRRTIGPTRSDALFARYSRTDDPRERNYYARSFQRGLDDPELSELDSAQCERAISSFTKKAGPTPQ